MFGASRQYELKKVVCILRRWAAVAGKSLLKRSDRRICLPLAASPLVLLPHPAALPPSLVSSGHLPGYERAPKGGLLKSLSGAQKYSPVLRAARIRSA